MWGSTEEGDPRTSLGVGSHTTAIPAQVTLNWVFRRFVRALTPRFAEGGEWWA